MSGEASVPGGVEDPRWAAVVVNHNSGGHLRDCVSALRKAGAASIVIIDNASTDGSVEGVEGVEETETTSAGTCTIVRQDRNLGYAAAANAGIALTDTPVVAVCNPDAEVEPDTVDAVLGRFVEPDVGAVGPRIHDLSGATYPSARTVPSALDAVGHGLLGLVRPDNAFTRRYRQLDLDPGRPRDVDWVSGAAIWLRRRALDEVDGWDDGYFMYVEDVDLCWRLRTAGWRIVYEPGTRVVHVQGVSTRRHPYRMLAAHHRSLFRFAAKRYRGVKRLLLPAAAVVLTVRAALTMVQHFTRSVLARAGVRRGSGSTREERSVPPERSE